MLKAKNERGEAQPYLPARRCGGPVADDLPAKRLSRLFSTNHYIVSMVNPIARAFYREMTKHVRFGRPRRLWGWGSVGRC